jgi:hypothetical protein
VRYGYAEVAGPLAQSAEQRTFNPRVRGSIPRGPTIPGYVTRVPDPKDRRAKLVLPTDRGQEVLAIARQLVPEIDDLVSGIVGADRLHALKADLEAIRRDVSGR